MYSDRAVSGSKRRSPTPPRQHIGDKRQRQYDDKWKHDRYGNDEPQVSNTRASDKDLRWKPEMKGGSRLCPSVKGPRARRSYDLQGIFYQDRDVIKYDIANESDKQKRGTQRSWERGIKESQEEDAGEGSVWEDRKRAMLARTKSSTESWTFTNSKREQEMDQQRGVEKQADVLETKRRSKEESSAEDEIPCREVSDVVHSKCPSKGTEKKTVSNITDALPPSIMRCAESSSPTSLNNMPHHKQFASPSNFSSTTPGEASAEVQMQEEGAFHQNKKDTSHDIPDIIASSSRSLSEGTQCDSSKIRIQPHNSRGLDCDESNQKKKAHPQILGWRYQLVVTINSAEDTQSQTCTGEVAGEVQTEFPLEATEMNTLSNGEDETPLSLRFTQSLPLANSDDNDKHVEGILEDGNSLFTQTRHLWETCETMEVFRSIPQQPHFRPLAEMNECLREGYAVGYIVSFVSVVQKVRELQFDEPNSNLIETRNALEKFETVGFDVQSIRTRLDKLLSIKTATEQLDAELEQVEEQIVEEKLEEDLLESMVESIDEKIRELEEKNIAVKKKREGVVMKRHAKDSSITALQRSIQESKAELQTITLHFTRLAGSPW